MLRRAALLDCGLVLISAADTSARSPRGWSPDMKAAIAYAKQRAGEVSFAVRTERRLYGFHAERTAPSASVVKAMLLVAYLNHPAVRHRRLRHADWALLSPMIRRSDNTTATRVRAYVGNWRLSLLAKRVGMRHFATDGWGAGTGSVDHQVALFTRGDERVSVAVLTLGNPNHAYGEATEEGVARRLLRGLAAR